MTNSTLQLCLVTKPNIQKINQYIKFLVLAIRGGVSVVQLRNKTASYAQACSDANAIKLLLKDRNIPLIINELGKRMALAGINQDNPYYNWIVSYSGIKFSNYSKLLTMAANEIAQPLNEGNKSNMIKSYINAIELEEAFWSEIYSFNNHNGYLMGNAAFLN